IDVTARLGRAQFRGVAEQKNLRLFEVVAATRAGEASNPLPANISTRVAKAGAEQPGDQGSAAKSQRPGRLPEGVGDAASGNKESPTQQPEHPHTAANDQSAADRPGPFSVPKRAVGTQKGTDLRRRLSEEIDVFRQGFPAMVAE